jgi:hypothetical protein
VKLSGAGNGGEVVSTVWDEPRPWGRLNALPGSNGRVRLTTSRPSTSLDVSQTTARHIDASSRKVAGSRPDDVNEFSNLPNLFSLTRPWSLLSLEQK